jgi:hypothetical protein
VWLWRRWWWWGARLPGAAWRTARGGAVGTWLVQWRCFFW